MNIRPEGVVFLALMALVAAALIWAALRFWRWYRQRRRERVAARPAAPSPPPPPRRPPPLPRHQSDVWRGAKMFFGGCVVMPVLLVLTLMLVIVLLGALTPHH